MEERERSQSSRTNSSYYSMQSRYYGGSNSNSSGKLNYNRPQYGNNKKNNNIQKFFKKKKAKGAAIDKNEEKENSNLENEESKFDPYSVIDYQDVPQPINNEDELKTQFRRLYVNARDDIREFIRRLSPQEKEERM
jgi:hypothetical protein